MHRVAGCIVAWHFRQQSKTDFLASNRTQKGQIIELERCSNQTLSWPCPFPSEPEPLLTLLSSHSLGLEFHCLG